MATFAWTGNGNTCQVADTPRLRFAPAEVNRQPGYTIKRMLGMRFAQTSRILFISHVLRGCYPVVCSTANAQNSGEPSSPSRVDLLQDG